METMIFRSFFILAPLPGFWPRPGIKGSASGTFFLGLRLRTMRLHRFALIALTPLVAGAAAAESAAKDESPLRDGLVKLRSRREESLGLS